MHRHQLPGRWREQLVLEDGRELILRPIEAEDGAALQRGFSLLDPEEVRMRFLHPMKELSPAMAMRLANPDPKKEFALVAAEALPPGEALVGAVARVAIDQTDEAGEFALIVSRFVGRQGLGRLLMKQLIRWCRLKRLARIYGDVLDENTAMLGLARSLGFRRSHPHQDPGITRVTLELRAQPSTH
ncbi:GNAT family N-acetyltransferase [Lysobacter sp. CAU 1642]|uniref:GNAT family N-acetyltransferase n=1 Tax=Pseudomarimonas salicorniae TaxID=2933270 RepID=A0ABT0GKJ2_9GAMM|nr:GNAT family N-acetyltransferase [Lysobacter sp. CAU 1642]